MATVIFDFDSTLINCESLEEILRPSLIDNPKLLNALSEITAKGMNGEISFQESLHQRLQLATPSFQALQTFAQTAQQHLTTGMKGLIQSLHQAKIDVWIISGGLELAILPTAHFLNIPASQVLAVKASWQENGQFIGISKEDICSQGKILAANMAQQHWSAPRIIVGDGMTDYQVYEANLTDYFIGYTEHANRPAIQALNIPKAQNVETLTKLLIEIIHSPLPIHHTS